MKTTASATKHSPRLALAAAFAIVAAFVALTLLPAERASAAAGKTGVWDIPGRHSVQVFHPGAAAATATSSEVVFEAPVACRLKRIAIVPSAGMTGDNTNYITLDFLNVGTAGVGTQSVVTAVAFTTGTDLTALDAKEFTLSTTDATITLAQGAVLTCKRTKAASGLLMPSCLVVVEFEPK